MHPAEPLVVSTLVQLCGPNANTALLTPPSHSIKMEVEETRIENAAQPLTPDFGLGLAAFANLEVSSNISSSETKAEGKGQPRRRIKSTSITALQTLYLAL